jgi:hypothetical protein
MQMFSAFRPELLHPFTGLQPAQFYRPRLIARRGGDTVADGRPGRSWALTLPDRVLLVAVSGWEVMADGAYRGNPK